MLTIDLTTDEQAVRPEGAASAGMHDVHLSGSLSKIDTELYFKGTVSAKVEAKCDRCLGPVRLTLEQPVEWYFERGHGEVVAEVAGGFVTLEYSAEELEELTGDSVRTFSGEAVDLGPCVWEELVLAMPSKLLCKEDCLGMCPQCGVNLNEGPCTCAVKGQAKGHPGLAKLKEMYPDLPDRVEE